MADDVLQITSKPNEQYLGYIRTTVPINNTDGFWDCVIWCTKVEGGYCHYYTWINQVCSIGNLDNDPNPIVDGPDVPIYINERKIVDLLN